MERKLIRECPVCDSTLQVRVLECPNCATTIKGDFRPPESKIFYLSCKELEFIELFVHARGSIKEMEKILGVSYPTVRSMLDAINKKLGYPVTQNTDTEERKP